MPYLHEWVKLVNGGGEVLYHHEQRCVQRCSAQLPKPIYRASVKKLRRLLYEVIVMLPVLRLLRNGLVGNYKLNTGCRHNLLEVLLGNPVSWRRGLRKRDFRATHFHSQYLETRYLPNSLSPKQAFLAFYFTWLRQTNRLSRARNFIRL